MNVTPSTATPEFAIAYQVTGRVTAHLKIGCRPGMITLLDDEVGHFADRCREAMAAFAESKGQLVFRKEEVICAESVAMVGVGERLPHLVMSEYLLGAGVPAERVGELIRDFELLDYEHLFCDVLPVVPARKLALLSALHNQAPLILLNDPFQPFSGRWRETLGEQLLNRATQGRCSIVCLNISFVPKCWSASGRIVRRDLRRLTEDAIAEREVELQRLQALAEAALRAEEAAAKKKEEAQRGDHTDHTEAFSVHDTATGRSSEPLNSTSATLDAMIERMAFISGFVRSWTGIAAACGVALLTLSIGVVMFPTLAQDHEAIRLLAMKLPVSWQQVLSVQQPDVPVVTEERIQSESQETSLAEPEEPSLSEVEMIAPHESDPIVGEPVEPRPEAMAESIAPPEWDDFPALLAIIDDEMRQMCVDRSLPQ
jgi:hypothetical protein